MAKSEMSAILKFSIRYGLAHQNAKQSQAPLQDEKVESMAGLYNRLPCEHER